VVGDSHEEWNIAKVRAAQTHTHTHTLSLTYTHTYTHTHTHTHTLTHTHSLSHTHTHTHQVKQFYANESLDVLFIDGDHFNPKPVRMYVF
jgi:hypothetical protein